MPANISYGPAAAIAARPASAPKRRKAPLLSTAQRKDMAAKSSARTAQLNADIATWYQESVVVAQRLSEKYGKKADVCLRLMFSGGAKLHTKRKPNAFNAWSHRLAQEANEKEESGVSSTNLLDLQKENIQQYHDLTDAQKAELVVGLEEERASRNLGLRATQRSRIRDVDNTCKTIEALLHGLKHCAGVEAFFCIVRNKPDYQMAPRWYFSSTAIDDYLRSAVRKGWDPEIIGTLTEAFAVAGCDIMNFLKTSKAKADWIKGQIRDKITAMLVEITGNKKAVMNYVSYEHDIVLRYGIELRGWTHENFVNPSNLSTSLPPLRLLHNALESGACKFVRLSAAEVKAREVEYDQRVAAGEVSARKQRKDKGGTHAKPGKKRRAMNTDEDGDNDDEVEQPVKKRRRKSTKSAAIVRDDDDEDEDNNGGERSGTGDGDSGMTEPNAGDINGGLSCGSGVSSAAVNGPAVQA